MNILTKMARNVIMTMLLKKKLPKKLSTPMRLARNVIMTMLLKKKLPKKLNTPMRMARNVIMTMLLKMKKLKLRSIVNLTKGKLYTLH